MRNILSKRDSTCQANNLSGRCNGWDRAIRDAKRGIERLQLAIEFFENRKASGEPWQGDETAGTAVKSIPAKG